MSQPILRLGTLLLAGFALVALALGYWQVVAAPELSASAYNPRLVDEAARVQRGRILDRAGRVLAESVPEAGAFRRVYRLPAAFHALGYFSTRFGAAGLEAAFHEHLSGVRAPSLGERLGARLLRTPRRGSDLVLTLDASVQMAAARALGEARGAVVALDPRSGAVLALYSSPFVDPNNLERGLAAAQQADDGPLFNRALQARYPPGSTFKLVTATAAVDLGLLDLDQPFTCSRPVTVVRLTMDCRNHAHLPRLTFQQAFAWSSNRTFGLTGLSLALPPPINPWLSDDPPGPYPWRKEGTPEGAERFEDYARRFLFDREIPFDLPVVPGQLKAQARWTPDLLAQTAFGQGELAESPLQAALRAATLANQGRLPAPYLAAEVRSPDGAVVALREPGGWLEQAMAPATAAILNAFMVESVQRGYGAGAALPSVQVAGKTGTAEVGEGRPPHAWFVGYAPADQPLVAVAVVVEHGGSGAEVAAPIAREVLAAALQAYRR